jgi:hypothetical protein
MIDWLLLKNNARYLKHCGGIPSTFLALWSHDIQSFDGCHLLEWRVAVVVVVCFSVNFYGNGGLVAQENMLFQGSGV